jgi:hypothetical protein
MRGRHCGFGSVNDGEEGITTLQSYFSFLAIGFDGVDVARTVSEGLCLTCRDSSAIIICCERAGTI